MRTMMQSKDPDRQAAPTGSRWPTRERVLEVACHLFAEAGFHGTHLREVSRRARANVAVVCYYFGSKEGLYEAVIQEASRQLANFQSGVGDCSNDAPPEDRLRALVQSLLEKLSGERAWIAKLLARELLDSVSGAAYSAGSGLQRDFVLFHGLTRELTGAEGDRETIRLHVLSILGECVFFSIAGGSNQRLAPELVCQLPAGAGLARHVANRSLGALAFERTHRGEPRA